MIYFACLQYSICCPFLGRRRGPSRNLLFAETDEYGNVIDPNSNKIISVAGGRSPLPLPPWTSQTPAVLRWMNKSTDPSTADKQGTNFEVVRETMNKEQTLRPHESRHKDKTL